MEDVNVEKSKKGKRRRVRRKMPYDESESIKNRLHPEFRKSYGELELLVSGVPTEVEIIGEALLNPVVGEPRENGKTPTFGSSTQTICRRKGESRQSFESRLAVQELSNVLDEGTQQVTARLENVKEVKARTNEVVSQSKPKEEVVTPLIVPPPPQSITTRGSLSSMKLGSVKQQAEAGMRRSRELRVKERGVMFGGLVKIPTNPSIDPPPHACFNCWRRGHTSNRCPNPVKSIFCRNCGRRFATLNTCPRCAEPHLVYLREQGGTRSAQLSREETRRPLTPAPVLSLPSHNERDQSEEKTTNDADFVCQARALTQLLAGLPSGTLDLAIRQLIEERKRNMETRAPNNNSFQQIWK